MLDDTITITVRGWYEVDNRLSELEANACNVQEMKIIRREIISASRAGFGSFEVRILYTFECASDAATIQFLAL